ncbi:Selenocysteine-specific elongation factor [Fasciolopsis buskii]|uniref:Selenocysteine-specific elongation factor n=1 Tax=Fasciolopsis buskii TaxID=27845 RepID=A0A8E0RZ47_9TREM|nr:Selenocysteine-specific elongation factor [Fasciolopsis buski]
MEFDQMCKQDTDRSDIEALIRLLLNTVTDPTERRKKVADQNFLFAVDHCFSVTGQGTVMTGTVLAGTVRVGEGDRAGICVPQLDPGLLERGLVGAANTGSLIPCHACILGGVKKIPYFKPAVLSKARFHVFVGQETALARITFFATCPSTVSGHSNPIGSVDLEGKVSYQYLEELPSETDREIWVLLEFERVLVCNEGGLVIGARLDSTANNVCRLAFHGHIGLRLSDANYKQTTLPKILVFRPKRRQGQVERIQDSRTCIVRGLFKRETNWDIFVGLRAQLLIESKTGIETGDSGLSTNVYSGRIDSSFGQSGKCRLVLDDDLPEEIIQSNLRKASKKNSETTGATLSQNRFKMEVVLEFKRHVFDVKRRILQ